MRRNLAKGGLQDLLGGGNKEGRKEKPSIPDFKLPF